MMQFRLCNGPATYQLYMNSILINYLDNFVIAYIDNIFIFSKTLE